MSFAQVQHVPTTGSSTNPTGTFSAATAGSLLVAVLNSGALGAASFTDPGGWTRRKAQDSSASTSCTIHLEKIAAGGETSVAWTGATASWEIEVTEWSGAPAAGSEFDTSTGASDPSAGVTSIQPGSITPAGSGELIIVSVGLNGTNGGSEAVDSGFTLLDDATFVRCVVAYKIKTDALAENPSLSWATARRGGCAMTAYKAAAGGGGVVLAERQSPRGTLRGTLRGTT